MMNYAGGEEVADVTLSSLFQDENGKRTFAIGGSDPWPSVLEKLELLRETDLVAEQRIQFCIWPGAPVSEVAEFLVETFECCSRKGYSWGRLVFQDFDNFDGAHLAVLNAACRNPLFQYLWIAPLSSSASNPNTTQGFRTLAERMNEETAHALRDAMIMNSSMEEICVFMQLTAEAFEGLGDGLKRATGLKTLKLHLGWNRQHDEQFLPPTNFIQGLQMNRSLQTLEIDGFPEEWPERILNALVHHDPRTTTTSSSTTSSSTLKTLSLKKCSWGEASFRALGSLISSSSPHCTPPRLTTLDISYPDISLTQGGLDVDMLSTALSCSNNTSIQTLKLRYCGLDHLDFATIYTQLCHWPNLVEIDLAGNQVCSLDGIVVAKSKKMTRLQRLDLSQNPILMNNNNNNGENNTILNGTTSSSRTRRELATFLRMHPELQCLGPRFPKSNLYSPEIQHLMDINSCGRILFCDGYETDYYSIWPRVLERANIKFRESSKRQANVIYHLIHGLSTSL